MPRALSGFCPRRRHDVDPTAGRVCASRCVDQAFARETIARHSKQPQARRRVQAPRSTDEASRRIVFLAQFLSHALAIFCRKFRAWRIKQVDTDALTLLPLPVSAAGMIVETHS